MILNGSIETLPEMGTAQDRAKVIRQMSDENTKNSNRFGIVVFGFQGWARTPA
jgi:hypothetical protein